MVMGIPINEHNQENYLIRSLHFNVDIPIMCMDYFKIQLVLIPQNLEKPIGGISMNLEKLKRIEMKVSDTKIFTC